MSGGATLRAMLGRLTATRRGAEPSTPTGFWAVVAGSWTEEELRELDLVWAREKWAAWM